MTVWEEAPEVIVPFAIDQEYVVAPAGPEAVLPAESAQTAAGVGVIDGATQTSTTYVRLPVQPFASVAVIVKVNVPAVVGVPVSAPATTFSPSGRAPPVREKA